MKKRITLALACAAVATGANAQGFEWGAKAGLAHSWHTETVVAPGLTGDVDQKGRTGFYAGVFVERPLGDFFGVQGELLYSQMGNRFGVGSHDFAAKTDYLVLPVLAKLYVLKNLSVDLGPQFGYLLSARDEEGDSHYDQEGLKKFDASFAAGLSYRIGGRFDVSARCNVGLTKIEETGDARNRQFTLGAGYRF